MSCGEGEKYFGFHFNCQNKTDLSSKDLNKYFDFDLFNYFIKNNKNELNIIFHRAFVIMFFNFDQYQIFALDDCRRSQQHINFLVDQMTSQQDH